MTQEEEMPKRVRTHIKAKYGSIQAAADALGCSYSWVQDQSRYGKLPHQLMLNDMNLRRVVGYVEKASK